jgi:hypothetical protein
MSTLTNLSLLSLVFVTVFVLAGCSKKSVSLGKEIPAGVETVKLVDLLASPAAWNGKTVIVKGNVSSQCASLCDFTLKDGASVVTVFPDGYSLPKLEIGRSADVYAQITSGEERVVVSALGIKFN